MAQLLSVDPGAERCGWAILEPGPKLIDSGVAKWPRNGREFQKYRLELEQNAYWFWNHKLLSPLIGTVVNETVPAVGFNVSTQAYLASCVVATLHVAAFTRGRGVSQVSARTVQSHIAKRGTSKNITKAQVRNGVIEIMPEVGQQLTQHLMEWDRWDAIAAGLCHLGYKL